MLNRGLILCLKNNIATADELAKKSNISLAGASAIINQDENLQVNDLKAICEYFKVSAPYFLCQTEKNNYPALQLEYALL